jgi:hypothetical protein
MKSDATNGTKPLNARRDRRRHRMYVTKNTEYHFRDEVCIAVRDRRVQRWLLTHQVLSRTLSGSVRFRANGDAYPTLEMPEVGDALFFGAGGPDVVTSAVAAIDRPAKEVVQDYPF